MRTPILFLFLSLSSLPIFAQPTVSLVDTLMIATEGDSLIQVGIRVENPDSLAFFAFSKDFVNSTVDHTLDYIDIVGEIISARDTLINFGIIILQDTLVEGAEELHFDLKKFFDSTVDTVNLSGQTHFVLIIHDDEVSTSNQPRLEQRLVFYPNPSTGLIHLEMPRDPDQLFVQNMLGQKANFSATMGRGEMRIDISNNPEGVYLIHVIQQGRQITEKVLLQKK
ncbi:MAG: T9SS type A sorting domain-containing protein [Bacteroidota bacterium]